MLNPLLENRHYTHYSNQYGRPCAAIKQGRHTLIYHYEDETVELFELVNDIAEKNMTFVTTPFTAQLKSQLLNLLEQSSAVELKAPHF